ncbi:CPK2, partial [Symbiodinium microadriaticum]
MTSFHADGSVRKSWHDTWRCAGMSSWASCTRWPPKELQARREATAAEASGGGLAAAAMLVEMSPQGRREAPEMSAGMSGQGPAAAAEAMPAAICDAVPTAALQVVPATSSEDGRAEAMHAETAHQADSGTVQTPGDKPAGEAFLEAEQSEQCWVAAIGQETPRGSGTALLCALWPCLFAAVLVGQAQAAALDWAAEAWLRDKGRSAGQHGSELPWPFPGGLSGLCIAVALPLGTVVAEARTETGGFGTGLLRSEGRCMLCAVVFLASLCYYVAGRAQDRSAESEAVAPVLDRLRRAVEALTRVPVDAAAESGSRDCQQCEVGTPRPLTIAAAGSRPPVQNPSWRSLCKNLSFESVVQADHAACWSDASDASDVDLEDVVSMFVGEEADMDPGAVSISSAEDAETAGPDQADSWASSSDDEDEDDAIHCADGTVLLPRASGGYARLDLHRYDDIDVPVGYVFLYLGWTGCRWRVGVPEMPQLVYEYDDLFMAFHMARFWSQARPALMPRKNISLESGRWRLAWVDRGQRCSRTFPFSCGASKRFALGQALLNRSKLEKRGLLRGGQDVLKTAGGVKKDTKRGEYIVQIQAKGKRHYGGRHQSEEQAYASAAKLRHELSKKPGDKPAGEAFLEASLGGAGRRALSWKEAACSDGGSSDEEAVDPIGDEAKATGEKLRSACEHQKMQAELTELLAATEPPAKKPRCDVVGLGGEAGASQVVVEPSPLTVESIGEPLSKKSKKAPVAKTLAYILELAELQNHTGDSDDDKVELCTARARKLVPWMSEFVCQTRMAEGFLSRAQIHQDGQGLSVYNKLQHELGKARAAQQHTQGRQSRFAAWSTFAHQASKKFNTEACKKDGQEKELVQAPAHFLPYGVCCPLCPSGCQVLGVRTTAASKPKLAVTLDVFRGSVLRKKYMTRLFSTLLPARVVKQLRVVLLDPDTSVEDEGSFVTFRCHAAGLVLTTDPHDMEGRVLFEVSPDYFRVSTDAKSLCVQVHLLVVKQLLKFQAPEYKPPAEKGDGKASKGSDKAGLHRPNSLVSLSLVLASRRHQVSQSIAAFSELSFGKSKPGLKAMAEYFHHMRSLYEETTGKGLLDADGRVLRLPTKPAWTTLVDRVGSFFLQRYKAKSGVDFGSLVLLHFQRAAPTPENGCGRFWELLKSIQSHTDMGMRGHAAAGSDGLLTVKELEEGMQRAGMTEIPPELNDIIKDVDSNGS